MTIYYLTYSLPDGNITDANCTANTVQEAMEVLMQDESDAVILSVVDTETNLETTINRYKFWNNRRLQESFHIEIETIQLPVSRQDYEPGTTQWVSTQKVAYFCSSIHYNKRSKIGPGSYSGAFTDSEVLNCPNLSKSIEQKYGTDIFASY